MGRLEPVDVRRVWKHEAHDFTTWLLGQAEVLGEALGMDLELTAAEHKVGGFALDLIGTDPASDARVIIENQLQQTDHTHLGQLMTYAGGTDAATIVWCASRFREEHRAALDWLNERTGEHTRFFGVEISAVRIGSSPPAPLFRVVAKPNDWTKAVHTGATPGALSGKAVEYQPFWTDLLDRIRVEHPGWTASSGSSASWQSMPYGTAGITYSVLFTLSGPRVELYFGGPDAEVNAARFAEFAEHREVLDAAFGPGVVNVDVLEGKKACRIHVDRPEGGDVLDESDREACLSWFLATLEVFRPATQQIRERIKQTAS